MVIAFPVQADRQALSGLQLDILRFTGQGIGALDIGAAADGDHPFAAQGGIGDQGSVRPGGFLGHIAGDGPDLRFLTGQGRAVIDLLRTARPDHQRGRIHDEGAAHGLHMVEMAGDVLSGGVIDRIGDNGVFALASIGLRTAGGDPHREVSGQAIDQGVGMPDQGRAVVEFAGALGDDGHLPIPCPVAVRRVIICLFSGFLDAAGNQQQVAVFAAVDHALGQGGIRVHGICHKAFDVITGQVRDDRGGLAFFSACIRGHIREGGLLSGRDRESPVRAGDVGIIDLGGAFKDTDGNGLAVCESGIRRPAGDIDEGAADAHSHGGGLDIEAFVFIQVLLHIQEESAFLQIEADML